MITPRATRLVRTATVRAFREAVVGLAIEGAPFDARDRLVIVPTRAAAAHLVRSIEDTLTANGAACLLPDVVTAADLVGSFALRLPPHKPALAAAEREVLLGAACRAVRDEGAEPPFRLRPGLVAAILEFYDTLRRQQRDVQTFERIALGILESGAMFDRGAERLVRQTRFLAAAFRAFERAAATAGADEHELRHGIVSGDASRRWRHVVVAVGDRAFDPYGLYPADWDLLARVPGLRRIDVVTTDGRLAGAAHERMHQFLPGIEECRFEAGETSPPVLAVPASDSLVFVARDREEEISLFARHVKAMARAGELSSLEHAALVVRQPLPYVYLAREVLRSASIAHQLFDTLPLAGEPYAAALDLVFSFVSANFSRGPAVALLRSPHFRFACAGKEPASAREVAALDRLLSESNYLGDAESLGRLVAAWTAEGSAGASPAPSRQRADALEAAVILQRLIEALLPLRARAPAAVHLDVLLEFLTTYHRAAVPPAIAGPTAAQDSVDSRDARARAAIVGTLTSLRDAYARFDDTPVPFDEVVAQVRRGIEAQTFSPRTGEAGVHVVDAASAPFGRFEHVHLAGLVEGEWPPSPQRNIFYSPAVLRELGWPGEADRRAGARAAFADLVQLPSRLVAASAFLLEADSLVSPSPLVDELAHADLIRIERPPSARRIFESEALASMPAAMAHLGESARRWASFRQHAPPQDDERFHGTTAPLAAGVYSLSGLERYQDCPFKFFASDVLRLEEVPEDEDVLSPRARGRFVHEVFQRFFEAWDDAGGEAFTAERVDQARELFAAVAEPLLARLPASDAALERTRLFGSAISVGLVDVVLGLEASRSADLDGDVTERWLEHRFDADFALGDPSGRRVALRGVADRIDLLAGRRLRVVDYKTGSAPNPRRALQVPIYALCAQEQLTARDRVSWSIVEAAYVAFSGKRTAVPVVRAGTRDADEILVAARQRLHDAVNGIERGAFPPRPHDPIICRYCAHATVCRKDYVEDDDPR